MPDEKRLRDGHVPVSSGEPNVHVHVHVVREFGVEFADLIERAAGHEQSLHENHVGLEKDAVHVAVQVDLPDTFAAVRFDPALVAMHYDVIAVGMHRFELPFELLRRPLVIIVIECHKNPARLPKARATGRREPAIVRMGHIPDPGIADRLHDLPRQRRRLVIHDDDFEITHRLREDAPDRALQDVLTAVRRDKCAH